VKASLCGQYFHSMGQVIELSLARYYNCQNTMTQIKANVSAEKLERLQYRENT
jgi:hypothetical protein